MIKNAGIVMCVERGILEKYSVLLLRSIRTFGGEHAKIPVYCYMPRKRFYANKKTVAEIRSLDGIVLRENLNREFFYYDMTNKAIACAHAEKNLGHQYILYLDTDTIFFGEPEFLRSNTSYTLSLLPAYQKGIGISGPRDPEFTYWRKIYQELKVNMETQPVISTSISGEPILPYYSGAVIWANTNLGFYSTWKENLSSCLRKKYQPASSIYFLEESVLSVTALKMNERIRPMDVASNLPIIESLQHQNRTYNNVKIIHHLDAPALLHLYANDPSLLDIEKEKLTWLDEQFHDLQLYPHNLGNLFFKYRNRYRKNFLERTSYLYKKFLNKL